MVKIKDSFSHIFSKLNRVLVILAHPDDIEINCGGLMARLIDQGKRVRLVVTTNGSKGTKDKAINEKEFAELRTEEQIKAGEILGISRSENFNLQIPDGELEASLENIEKIVFHIRQFKPDLVITHNPQDTIVDFYEKGKWVNHRDHRNTGLIVLDSVYPYSRDRGFFPHHFKQSKLSGHTVNKLLLTDSYKNTSVKYFAIDNYLDKKKAALQQHLSAFDPADIDGYLEENKFGNHYFEPLGYYEVY